MNAFPSVWAFAALLLVLVLFACHKDLPEIIEPEHTLLEEARLKLRTPQERNFFEFSYLDQHHPGILPREGVEWRDAESDAFILSVIDAVLLQNSADNFVPDLIQRYGYPAWSRSDVRRDSSNQWLVAYIPFAKPGENQLTAYLLVLKPGNEWFFRMVAKPRLLEALDPAVVSLNNEAKELYVIGHLMLDNAMFGVIDSTLVNWLVANGDEDTEFDSDNNEIDYRCTEMHIYLGECRPRIYVFHQNEIEERDPCPPGEYYAGEEIIAYGDDCTGFGFYFPTGTNYSSSGNWYSSNGGSVGGGAPPPITYDNHPVLMPIMQLCNQIDQVLSGEVINGQTYSQADIDRCNAIQNLIMNVAVSANDLAWLVENRPDVLAAGSNYVSSGERTPVQLEGLAAYLHLLAMGQTDASFTDFMRLYQLVFGNLVPNLDLTEEEAWDLMEHEHLAQRLGLLLTHENNSTDAKAIAEVLVDISIENEVITDEQVIGLTDQFDVYLDNPEGNAENLVDYFFDHGLNPLLVNPGDAFLDNNLTDETTFPSGINWQDFTASKVWELAGVYKTNLLNTYLTQQDKIEQLFPCRVLGPAFEDAVLNSFNVPSNTTNYEGAVPDGVFHNYTVSLPFSFVEQPVFIEVKGRFGNDPVFDYSGQMQQFNRYIEYLQSEVPTNNTILHGLYLVLPAGKTVSQGIVNQATQKNVPLFFSQVQLDPHDGNKVQVKNMEILNLEGLNRQGHMFSFLPDNFYRWGMRQLFKRRLAYQKATFNLQYYSQQFENSFLIGNQPPTCPEE